MGKPQESVTYLLDRHWAALLNCGHAGKLERPGLDRDYIRAALVDANYGTSEAVIDFFAWAHYPEPARDLDLFEYYGSPFSLAESIRTGESYRKFWFEVCPKHDLAPYGVVNDHNGDPLPGAEHIDLASWLPILMGVDTADVLVVDTSNHPVHGGSIWLTTKSSYIKSHESLPHAISDSTRCVEAGLWLIEDGTRITRPDRTGGHSFADLGPC